MEHYDLSLKIKLIRTMKIRKLIRNVFVNFGFEDFKSTN